MVQLKITDFFPVLLLLYNSEIGVNGCSFPTSLVDNTWLTSNRGTWVVNSTHISDMKITASTSGASLFTMQCYDDSTGNIVLKSEEIFYPFTTIPTYIYTCIKLTESSSNKYTYSMLGTLSLVVAGVYERIILKHTSITTVLASEVCTDTDTSSPDRIHLALKNGTEISSATSCPSTFQGYYTYDGTSCANTSLSTCTDSEVNFNYTTCSEQQMYSSDGQLYCMYYGTGNGYTYLTLYNADSSVDSSSTFQFTCMVYSVSGTTVSSTINPEECLPTNHQTATSINATNGKVIVFTDTETPCTTPTTSAPATTDNTWIYIVIAIIVLLVIIAIAILIICIIKRRRRPKVDEEKPITEKEDEKKEAKKEDQEEKDNIFVRENEEDKTSIDSGFIPDKIDKEEQEANDEKREDVVKVEEDGTKEENKDRPVTGVSKMSDLGSTIAPSEQVDDQTLDELEEDKEEEEKQEPEEEPKENENDEEMEDEKEDEKENENEDKTEDENENDDDNAESSRTASPEEDPEEVERRIRMIGMKKTGQQYAPKGQISKVLVTRAMEEKTRNRKEKTKWKKGLGMLTKMKTKKGNDRKNVTSPDPDMDNVNATGKTKAPFIEQYENKKRIEKKLDDEHYWSEEDDIEHLRFVTNDDEFEDSFPSEKEKEKEDSNKETNDIEMTEIKTLSNEPVANEQNQTEKDREKDSGNDSPDFDKIQQDQDDEKSANVDSDPDLGDLEDDLDDVYVKGTSNLPLGYIRDTEGRIIRQSDGKEIPEEVMEKYFQKARIKRLFKIARLRRNKKGRPTGGFIQDDFGPEIKNDKRDENMQYMENETEDGPRPKQPRSSDGTHDNRRVSSTKADNNGGRTVIFNVADNSSGNFNMDPDSDDIAKGGRNASPPSRELLKKRLFKSKKRKDPNRHGKIIHVAGLDEDKPRELNSLVKVYGKPGNVMGMDSRPPLPPSGLSRNDSKRASTDPELIRQFRQGLQKDQMILNNKQGPRAVKEAFGGPDGLQKDPVSMEDEDNQLDQAFYLGDEDEFVVVGPGQSRIDNKDFMGEKFFTILKHPENRLRGKNHPGPWCSRHDLRHSIPWSLRAQPLTRHNTALTDSGSDARTFSDNTPKSADASKRDIDESRLKQLLEELYRDKKYFDHVINTTDHEIKPNPVIDERDLAQHGRGYLLDRADYWDQRLRENPIPLPPWFVPSRMHTEHKLDSGRGSQTSTMTPPIIESECRPNTVPRRENTVT